MLEWRKLVWCAAMVIAPAQLFAQFSERALLRNDGGTWLNESPAPAVTAMFPDSLVQTQADHAARIEAEGSTVLIGGETVVQYQGHELALDHGRLQLDTARQMEVLIGCITVTPINSDRTQYDVTDVDGKVRVVASRNDVKIHLHGAAHKTKDGTGSDLIVHEGEEKSHSEHCGALIRPTEAVGGVPGILDTTGAKIGAGLIIGGGTLCVLFCESDNPVSPSKP